MGKRSPRHAEMKTALIILSALTSGLRSRGLESNNVEVSFGEAQGRASGLSKGFFWCNIYQKKCVSGCSVESCDATCTVSSWFFTCEYQCGDVTDQCTQAGADGAETTEAPTEAPPEVPTTAGATTLAPTTLAPTTVPTTAPTCGAVGDPCLATADCCSNNCDAGNTDQCI